MHLGKHGLETALIAAAVVAAGVVLALVAHLLFKRLAKSEKTTKFKWDRELTRAVGLMVETGLVLLAIEIASRLVGLTPEGRHLVSTMEMAALFLVATILVARVATNMVKSYSIKRSGMSQAASLFVTITRALIFVLGFLVILENFGVSITPMLTALGVGGLAVALALQDTLSNLFAGVHLLASRKIEPGDYVKLASGEEGYITDVNWRNTSIRALSNNMIVVPNSGLASQVVTNYHQPITEMSVVIQVGVAYDSDLEQVEEVTKEVGREVLKEIEGAIPEFEPLVRYHTFGSSSINFSLILRVQEYVDQFLLTHECIKRLHRRYKTEGIEIPFPITTVIMDNG